MIVDDTADVKQRTGFKFTCLPQELVGLLGVGLQPLLVHVEPVSGIERVFQELFELIDRANPVLHAFGGTAPKGRRCERAFAFLSHKKVTKRLWPAASYGKIGVVGYRLLQERDG